MKRSEMIKIMMDGCWENKAEQDIFFTKNDADRVLTAMENAGMIPPTLTGTVETEETEDGGIVIKLWGWEPEDETK
jgi:hypothetical protein